MSPPSDTPGAPTGAELLFMGDALEQARAALAADEVPIGAVVVLDGAIIGRGHNGTRRGADPTAHAEMIALREAARRVGAQRIPGAILFCTVEPCFMCAGAASHARVARIVFGVHDEKFGACGSLGDVPRHTGLNHQSTVLSGVRADECRDLLLGFFREKRAIARRTSEEGAPPLQSDALDG